MPLPSHGGFGMSMRFQVVVDEIDLGGWSTCSGLSAEFKHTLETDGGSYGHKVVLPETVEYPMITLQRAMVRQDSMKVQHWLSKVVSKWFDGGSPSDYSQRTARISLYDAQLREVISWSLRNVYPSSWTGPNLDATGHLVAVETLKLVHEGFL